MLVHIEAKVIDHGKIEITEENTIISQYYSVEIGEQGHNSIIRGRKKSEVKIYYF